MGCNPWGHKMSDTTDCPCTKALNPYGPASPFFIRHLPASTSDPPASPCFEGLGYFLFLFKYNLLTPPITLTPTQVFSAIP